MPYTPIVATLGYVLSPDRSRVLMIHRNARPGDQHLGKYNGLGGKIERDEDVVAGLGEESVAPSEVGEDKGEFPDLGEAEGDADERPEGSITGGGGECDS